MAKKKKKASKKKAATRGGARPNSGPSNPMKGGRVVSIWLGDAHLKKLDKLEGTRSEAIRQLIGTKK